MTDHPYTSYQNTPTWEAVDAAIAALVENNDIVERTRREHIVGYITKLVAERRLTSRELRRVRRTLAQTRQASEQLATVLANLGDPAGAAR